MYNMALTHELESILETDRTKEIFSRFFTLWQDGQSPLFEFIAKDTTVHVKEYIKHWPEHQSFTCQTQIKGRITNKNADANSKRTKPFDKEPVHPLVDMINSFFFWTTYRNIMQKNQWG